MFFFVVRVNEMMPESERKGDCAHEREESSFLFDQLSICFFFSGCVCFNSKMNHMEVNS